MFRHLFLICITSLLVLSPVSQANEPPTYTVGIVPQQSVIKMVRLWTPILENISKKSGVALRFKTATDIAAFEDRLLTGEYDFAYMNPYHYVVFNEKSGYRAIARERDKRIQGIIVTHRDSKLETVGELANEVLAFPSEAAFAASILPRAALHNDGIDFEPRYAGSHDSVYHLVARKRYPAGGGIFRTYNAINPAIQKQLRILWTSKKYSPHAFAVHKRVPANTSNAFAAALTAIQNTEAGRQQLKALHLKGFIPAENRDWDDIRELGLDALK